MVSAFPLLALAAAVLGQQYNSPNIDAVGAWVGLMKMQIVTSNATSSMPTFWRSAGFLSSGSGVCWDTWHAGAWLTFAFGWTPVLINYLDIYPATVGGDLVGMTAVTLSYSNNNVTWSTINGGVAYPLTVNSNSLTRIVMSTTIWASYLRLVPSGVWSQSGTSNSLCCALEVNVKMKCRP